MPDLHDTQPNRPVDVGVPAPPRLLLWAVLGLFVLGIAGAVAGVVIFREVLKPSQQVRVINSFPFMEAFLPEGNPLPTAPPVDEESLNNLLQMPLNRTETATPEATTEPTTAATATQTPEPSEEVTEEAAVPATPDAVAAAPTATTAPAPTLEPTPAPTTGSAPSGFVRPVSHLNTGFRWERQDWNNCGPTNITMALSFYGWQQDQTYAESILRPEREDKNVSPSELVDFVNEESAVRALYRMGGDIDILRNLVASGFPVIIETGAAFEGYEWLGHYQTIVGYDDLQQAFIVNDSFQGASITETYLGVQSDWQAFNYLFIVVYEPAREPLVMEILGDLSTQDSAAEQAFNVAQVEARRNPQNGFAWFNLGTSLVEMGSYEEAALAFDQATRVGIPRRMLWYQFGPFVAYYNVGRYNDVLVYAENNLTNGAEYVEETYYWQGRALQALGRTQEARNAFRTALQRNRNYAAAQQALDALNS